MKTPTAATTDTAADTDKSEGGVRAVQRALDILLAFKPGDDGLLVAPKGVVTKNVLQGFKGGGHAQKTGESETGRTRNDSLHCRPVQQRSADPARGKIQHGIGTGIQ